MLGIEGHERATNQAEIMVLETVRPFAERGASQSQTGLLIVVSAAHLVSHFYILVLPVLLPLLKDALGVGFFEIGLALTAFNVVTGLTQAPMGFLVDRAGPRLMLVAGLCLGGLAFATLGVATTYPVLIAVALLAGLANCVYHPADYALLADAIPDHRIGRAFSVHTFAGFAGGAIAPPLLLGVAAYAGLASALIVAGLVGPAVAGLLLLRGDGASAQAKGRGGQGALASVLNPSIIGLTGFFTLLALAGGGIQSFSVVALLATQDMTLTSANIALTAYLTWAAIGVLAGGVLADRTAYHGYVAAIGFGLSTAIVALVAVLALPAAVIVGAFALAGFLSGIIMPSRDMLVRKAAPPGMVGRAFGIVSTGFNIGGIIGPMLFGWIMDHASPAWVFGVSALFMAVTAAFGLASERRVRRRLAAEVGTG
jgi:MFS transporter, FSR family, fosmidomycin resistance protein